MNLYDLLGVKKNASQKDIKKAYKGKAMILHPDRNGGEDKGFDALKKAYEVLSDKERRKRYDETGETDNQPKSEDILRTELVKLFGVLLDTERNFKTVDFVNVGINNLNIGIQKLKSELSKNQAGLDLLATAKNRMTKKDDKPNLFDSLLEQREANINRTIENINEAIEIHHKLIEELKTYEYAHEKTPSVTFGGGSASRDGLGLGGAFSGHPFGGGM